MLPSKKPGGMLASWLFEIFLQGSAMRTQGNELSCPHTASNRIKTRRSSSELDLQVNQNVHFVQESGRKR